jgi:dienelactone hydrolase
MKPMSYLFPILLTLPLAFLHAQTRIEPKHGIETPSDLRAELEKGIGELDALAAKIGQGNPHLADAMVFQEAVRRTLQDGIFYDNKEFDLALKLLVMGRERLTQLVAGKTPWAKQTGLVVRGYFSKLDGSLQPYGLVVPETYKPGGKPMRVDLWQHGRSNKLSEVSFIGQRLAKEGTFAPADTLVLHPYGRYCNAMKFAGEVDTFEALEAIKRAYPVDEKRVCMRGFSMGGAACWHLGVHHADKWAAVNPGAGFAETMLYQGLEDKLTTIPWYEQKLWGLYDAVPVAVNFENTTLVAYSGEVDKQKAAADLMEATLAKEGIKMTHIVGSKTGHKYEPKAQEEVAALVDSAAARGVPHQPSKIRFQTFTLKYNRMHWITLDALEKHWEPARVEGELKEDGVHLATRNIAALSLDLESIPANRRVLHIDGQLLGPTPAQDGEKWAPNLHKTGGKWKLGSSAEKGLRKKHNLQGPIDDAFMDSFLIVTPSGKSKNPKFDQWVEKEIQEFCYQWRLQFRGEPRVKKDIEVTLQDHKDYNLVLFGNTLGNRVIHGSVNSLPYRCKQTTFEIHGKQYSYDAYAPALIYPNPQNPKRYIVINSGFTFAAAGAASNSRQTPRLPDWAILDISVPPLGRADGKGVTEAGFFNERWEF